MFEIFFLIGDITHKFPLLGFHNLTSPDKSLISYILDT
uniref:Uncharacterized protein n=2 Tax=Viruses TaxID=10239 RepID=A0A8S5RJB4_9VIRU|nr:MAG TPA: hypothetical protein [virus sp. ctML55]DAF44788.1 MAG TPA: hypothetical protein [Podoviridae sp. ct8Lf7]